MNPKDNAIAKLDKLVSMVDQLNIPEPKNKDEVLGIVAGISAAYTIINNGEELSKEELEKATVAIMTAYGFDGKTLTERTVMRESIGSMAKYIASEILDNPKIAAVLLTILLAGGIAGGRVFFNNNDYHKIHDCQDAICQTYENQSTAYNAENGGTTTRYYANGSWHVNQHSNPEWVRQQAAIKQYHNSGHDHTAKFDANGILPGHGSVKKGGGERLGDYIPRHAQMGFHAIPESTKMCFDTILRI